MEAAGQSPPTNALILKSRCLNHRITAKRFSPIRVYRARASTCAAGNCSALDDAGGRKNDTSCVQGGDNRSSNGVTTVGTPGGLRRSLNHHRQVGGNRQTKPQASSEYTGMVRHGLRTVCILGKRCCWNFQLLCKPLNKRFDRLLQLCKRDAGVAKQSELNGKANAIGIPATACHEVLVGSRQSEVSRHAVGIERDAEESLALLVGQQLSVRHHCPPADGWAATLTVAVRQTNDERSLLGCPETLAAR